MRFKSVRFEMTTFLGECGNRDAEFIPRRDHGAGRACKDQAGNEYTMEYDDAGREIHQRVSTVASGVGCWVGGESYRFEDRSALLPALVSRTSMVPRSTPRPLPVGFAALSLWAVVFVSLGGHGHVAPSLTAPFSLLLAPAIFIGCSSVFAAAVPAIVFVLWASSRKASERQRTNMAVLLVVLVASIAYGVSGWSYGLRYQGESYNIGMAIIGFFGWTFLLWAWIRPYLAHSQRVWLTVAWLFTYAFPYYGERL